MKIVCENCGAKYSIADEKIRGKVFKIRCKKCSESIVIRGDAQPEPPAAEPAYAPPPMPESADHGGDEEDGDAPTRVFDYSGYQGDGSATDEAVWHIVVEGEQQGPYTAGQLAEYVVAGNLDFDTFVWREGFDDWKPIRDVPEIAGMATGGGQPAAVAAAAAGGPFDQPAAAGGGLFDQPAESGGGLFDQPAAAGGGLFDQPAAGGGGLFDQPAAGGGGLFDQPAESGGGLFDQPAESGGGLFDQPAESGGGLFDQPAAEAGMSDGGAAGHDLFSGGESGGIFASTGPAPASPRVDAQQAMTGARNENSVLFSLSSLQALASGGATAGASSDAGFGALGSKPAGKSDDVSGLIDIRSLAGSVSADKEADGPPDDILSIGGGGFAPALGAPVLTAQREGMGMGAKIGIIGGAVAVAAVAVIVLVMALQPKDEPTKEAGPDPQLAQLLAEIEKLKSSGASAEDVRKMEDELAAEQARQDEDQETAETADDDEKPDSKEAARPASTRPASTRPASTAKAAPAAESKPAAAPSKPRPSGGVSELDDLLGGASSKPASKPKAASAPPAASPSILDQPSREQVVAGMRSVTTAVRACDTAGAGGTVTVQVTIAPSGRVTNATPTGASAGTPVGLCAARAVRRAKFPESKRGVNVTYPFSL